MIKKILNLKIILIVSALLMPSFVFAAEKEHWSVMNIVLPDALQKNILGMFGKTWFFHDSVSSIVHVFMALVVLIVVIVMAVIAHRTLKQRINQDQVIPDEKFSVTNIFEIIIDSALDSMAGMMGEENALKYFPLIGGLAFFILFSNLLGQIPGFIPPTSVLNTNFAMALIVFVYYNYQGFKAHGIKYISRFFGPIRKWYALPLMLFMFMVEIIGHIVRPVSLSIRLMGNIFGDHMVLSIFLGFHVLFLPIPMELLGILVAFIQTFVFCLLSVSYIAMAIQEED